AITVIPSAAPKARSRRENPVIPSVAPKARRRGIAILLIEGLSGRLRFLDSLRSLGMTLPSTRTAAIPRCARNDRASSRSTLVSLSSAPADCRSLGRSFPHIRIARERYLMTLSRAAGILLHPTSLPGPNGIGELGSEAHRFLDFLAATGITIWQVLPLGPTGYGDSPYQCFSAFAGNPLLISLERLVDDGLLDTGDLGRAPHFDPRQADFVGARSFKQPRLDRAFERFQ